MTRQQKYPPDSIIKIRKQLYSCVSNSQNISAFLLPVSIMLVLLAFQGIQPFYKSNELASNILTIDSNVQYISFFSYYKEILKGNADFIYTFSKTLGGDMVGLSAYYLMSPLNLIFLLFPTKELPVAFMLLTLLKIGLCGLTFHIFLSFRYSMLSSHPVNPHSTANSPSHDTVNLSGYRKNNSWSTVLFSSAYALMGYNIVYHHNIMWMDVVLLLPLVLLGIHRIFEGKSPWLYLGALFASLVTNYYIGYMVCIFSVLYFFTCLLGKEKRNVSHKKVFIRYGLSSLLAGGLSSFLLIPAFRSLEGGKAAFNFGFFNMEHNFHWSDLLSKFLIGSSDYEQIKHGLPVLFCGLISLLFVGIWFLSARISLRRKAGALFLMGMLLLSFYFKAPNLFWHGMNEPAWYPYRYSFVCICFLLSLAFEGWQISKAMGKKERLIIGLILCMVLYGILFWMMRKQLSFLSEEKYMVNAAVITLAFFIFSLLGNRFSKASYWLCGFLLLFELTCNGKFSMDVYYYQKNKPYTDFVESAQPAVEYVKDLDTGFYRMEKTFSRRECDPMLLNYKGLSHYSSTEKSFVKEFMGKLGFRNNGSWAYYNKGSAFATDALLGVKYVLSKDPIGTGYTLLDQVGDIGVYRNEYALPIGFMVDETAAKCNMDETNKFELQSHIWQSLSTDYKSNALFSALNVMEKKLHNLEKLETENGGHCYRRKEPEKKAYIEYQVTVKDSNPIFAFLTTDDMQFKEVKISVNGKSKGNYFSIYQYNILRLGEYKAGDKLKIRLTLKEEEVYIYDTWIYSQNMGMFQDYYKELRAESVEITSSSDSKITGTIYSGSNKPYVMFTIPYEKNWQVWVDGQKTTTFASLDTFLTAEIDEGIHEIILEYIPSGKMAGFLVSIFSLCILIFWIFIPGIFGFRLKTIGRDL